MGRPPCRPEAQRHRGTTQKLCLVRVQLGRAAANQERLARTLICACKGIGRCGPWVHCCMLYRVVIPPRRGPGRDLDLVVRLALLEVEQSESAQTLFRGNSLATKVQCCPRVGCVICSHTGPSPSLWMFNEDGMKRLGIRSRADVSAGCIGFHSLRSWQAVEQYLKMQGRAFLWCTLSPVMNEVLTKEVELEINPDANLSIESLARDQESLEYLVGTAQRKLSFGGSLCVCVALTPAFHHAGGQRAHRHGFVSFHVHR
jgi:hypothetical protein